MIQIYSSYCKLAVAKIRPLFLFHIFQMRVLKQKNKAFVGGYHLYAMAKEDTWTHARRRRREAMLLQKQQQQSSEDVSLNEDRKRAFPVEEAGDPNNPQKRRRMEDICDEGLAWIEEVNRSTSSAGFDESEVIFKANFYVMSEKKTIDGVNVDDGEDEDEDSDDGDDDDGFEEKVEIDGDGIVNQLIISVEWLGGTDREMANRVLCYLKNKLK